jgi:methylase of polypeptide subunit release factors
MSKLIAPEPLPAKSDNPLSLDPKLPIGELKSVLEKVGFTAKDLHKILGIENIAIAQSVNIPVCKRRLPKDAPLTTLYRLFRFGHAVPQAEAEAAFAPVPLPEVLAMGLVEAQGEAITSAFDLMIYQGVYYFSDRLVPVQFSNFVLGLSGSGIIGTVFTIRAPVKTACDLGTGNGLQALLAARHAQHVVATDINRRALNVAAFNARLNGISNIEFRHGSWFDPIQGEEFDLVVSNPPFVISPLSRAMFRDSGMKGDTISKFVVQGAAKHLKVGGYATVLGCWGFDPKTDNWSETPKDWLADSGVDVIALLSLKSAPLEYAMNWINSQVVTPEVFDAMVEQWLDYYEECGLQGMATGGLVLRRPAPGTGNSFFAFSVPDAQTNPCSDQLLLQFQAQDLLRSLPRVEGLLDLKFRVVDDHRLVQQMHADAGKFAVQECYIQLTRGLSFSEPINPTGLNFLLGMDGTHTVREIIHHVQPIAQQPPEQFQRASLDAVKRWLVQGLIRPVV